MRFDVILADPPWQFRVWSKKGNGRSAESHYSTMIDDHLVAMSAHIQGVAADDCALLMWAVMPSLPQAIELGAAWGFKYQTVGFTWAKTTRKSVGRFTLDVHDPSNWFMGMGYYTRANAELCLLFTRGKPKRIGKGVRQLIVAPIAAHSQKPNEQYSRIERLYPDRRYLELFARRPREGWTCIGNELTGRDICDDLSLLAIKE